MIFSTLGFQFPFSLDYWTKWFYGPEITVGDPLRYRDIWGLSPSGDSGDCACASKQLLHFGLIQHHLERIEKRREWYSITDKGIKILNHLNEILELMDSE